MKRWAVVLKGVEADDTQALELTQELERCLQQHQVRYEGAYTIQETTLEYHLAGGPYRALASPKSSQTFDWSGSKAKTPWRSGQSENERLGQ